MMLCYNSHNPYFNRWFSAMISLTVLTLSKERVTILILIDGFLQFYTEVTRYEYQIVTILILIDGFLQ